MSRTATVLTWITPAQRMFGGLALVVLIAALASIVSGCVTVHRHAARPSVATLEIEVQGQWKQVQRTVYEYPEDK